MKIIKGIHIFNTINIDGEEYIKLKDVNRVVAACYRDIIQRGMKEAFEKYWDFILNLEREDFDVEKEFENCQRYKE